MSAASKKKHSNAHKGFQAGADQLEVSALIAGAGNGRDVEERLGGGRRLTEREDIKPEDMVFGGAPGYTGEDNGGDVQERLGAAIDGVTNLPTNEAGEVSAEDIVKAGNELNATLKEISGSTPGIGNEGPVTAGNADTPAPKVEQRLGRLARAILTPDDLKAPRPELDLSQPSATPGYVPPLVPNALHKGRNVITIVTRGVKPELFSTNFNEIVKHLLELAPESISGLSTGFYESADGVLEDNQVSPLINATEREGRPYDRILTEWARRFNDYRRDSKKSVPASQKVTLLKEEDVTINLFFIEPDETGTKVLAAWQGTNVRPSSYHGIESIRNIHGSISQHTLTIGLEGNFKRGDAVLEAAQKAFDALNVVVKEELMYVPV
ncbi:hypothetical protein [Burkholderia phage FLC9]|nr:hypothetical protein [Burkholderia phage FLC9]